METRDELRILAEANAASPEVIEQAMNSLASADRHPGRRYWRPALYLVTLLISLPVLVHSAWQFCELAGTNQFSPLTAKRDLPLIDPTARFTAEQRLILFGDERAGNEADRWKALWQSDPENPSYFMEYAAAYFRVHHTLSPEILETAARIDPDNAWYAAVEASAMAEKAVKKHSPGYDARKRGEKATFSVTDEEAFVSALERFHQMTAKSRLSGNQMDLQQQRFALLPERKDMVSQLPAQVFAASQNCVLLDIRSLADAISVQAGRCAERKDVAGFQQLVADWRWLVRVTAQDGISLIDLMVAKAFFTMPLSYLSEAAKQLGLDADAEKFASLHQQNEDRRNNRNRDGSEHVVTKGSIMASLTLPMIRRQTTKQPPITEADLRPGRYADHAVFGRAHALLSWAVLGICAGLAALSRLRGEKSVIRLSARLQDLFGWSDWLRILIGGILVPLFWYLAITRLTPLSAREWGMKITGFQQPAIQLFSLTLLMLAASSVIASRLMVKRAGFLGLAPRLPWLGWVAVVSAALAIPVSGAMLLIRPLGYVLYFSGWTFCGVAFLWLLWGFFCHVLGKPSAGALRRTTLARMMVPAWVFGMLISSLLVLANYAEERRWIQQDRLLEITAETHGMCRYERDLTGVFRKELMEALD